MLAGVNRCHAATYFIDYSAGSDSANGTSTSTPFQHCPTDEEATGTAASTTLTSGDVVKFKGGISYVLTSTDSSGITMVSGVTYDGNSDGSWGTGNAILTDNNSKPGHVVFNASTAVNNIAFKNLNFSQIAGITNISGFPTNAYDGVGVAENDGFGILFNGGSAAIHDLTVLNCHFSQIGYWFNTPPMNAGSINGIGIFFNNLQTPCYNILIKNCVFDRMGKGVSASTGLLLTNLTITGCTFTNTFNWCINVTGNGSATIAPYIDFITVTNCTFGDYYGLNQDNWTGYGGAAHVDGIYFFDAQNMGDLPVFCGTNIFVCNNLFYATTGTGGGNAAMFCTGGLNLNFYNNLIIYGCQQGGGVSIGNGSASASFVEHVNIFNNTFVGNDGNMMTGIGSGGTIYPQKENFLNNIYYNTLGFNTQLIRIDGTGGTAFVKANWLFDYNDYSFHTNDTFAAYVFTQDWPGGGRLANLPAMAGSLNSDAHSLVTLNSQSPSFVDVSQSQANCLLNNLHLQTGSLCIGAGTNLSAYRWIPGLNIDRDGNQRPAAGPWDIGAYQYTGVIRFVSPPELLPIKPTQ